MKYHNFAWDSIVLVALFCCGLAGCGRSSSGHASSSTWGAAESGGVPGIDSGTLTVAKRTVNENSFQFAVWNDLSSGSGVSGSSGPAGWTVEGTVGCRGGQQESLPFQCTVSDDMSATMTIAGVDYEVPDGTLFLVATGGEEPEVFQLDFDLETLPANVDSYPEFAESNPQIAEFFRTASGADADGETDQ